MARHLLTLSAKNEKALDDLIDRYIDFLASKTEDSLADICFTTHLGRAHFDQRLSVVASSKAELRETLSMIRAGEHVEGVSKGQAHHQQRIAFLFTGQGSQYAQMGYELYKTQPTFRQALERCDEILQPYLAQPLLSVLYPKTGETALLNQTVYTQPALFALEYALAQLWKSWGIEPDIVMGHSVGEIVAACLAGVFSLEDGLKLIAARGRLMQALPQEGQMVSVMANSSQVQPLITPYKNQVSIAAVNGPQSVVISGFDTAIESIVGLLQAAGIKTRKLTVSHAFHSPLMEPMLADFAQVAEQISYSAPKIAFVSNVTGQLASSEVAKAAYWVRHVREAVQFMDGMRSLHQASCNIFVEIGPKPTLLGMGRQCLGTTPADNLSAWLPSLRPGRNDWTQLLQSLGELYVRGCEVDWVGFNRDDAKRRRKVSLPTYPFQRERYWVSPQTSLRQTQGVTEVANSPIVRLLNQGNAAELAGLLEKAATLSPQERELMPKLLNLLVQQHQRHLANGSNNEEVLSQQGSDSEMSPLRWLYEVQWQRHDRDRSQPKSKEGRRSQIAGKSWLIFTDSGGLGQGLADLLHASGASSVLVSPGERYEQIAKGHFSIRPTKKDDFQRLFVEIEPPDGVVHLWTQNVPQLTGDAPASEADSFLLDNQSLGCGSVLHLIQGLVKMDWSPRLWLVTQGAVSIGENALREPHLIPQSMVWGLGSVIALEHPEFHCVRLDLAPDHEVQTALEALLVELQQPDAEDQIAYSLHENQSVRHVARLRQLSPSSYKKNIQINEKGSYLITGGLGALGLMVADFLVKQGARYLILTGRRGASSTHQQQAVRSLELAGAHVRVVKADVSNREDVASLLSETQHSWPPLRGIVHAAGVLDDGILINQSVERFARVMAPKVQGTWNLHLLTTSQEMPLDFFVCFSSAASLLGSPGQANYAAANAFMDALAHHRQQLGLPALSINWGDWAEAGMAANLNRTGSTGIARAMGTITKKEGLKVFGELLRQPFAQVGVMPINWSKFASLGQEIPFLSDTACSLGMASQLSKSHRDLPKSKKERELAKLLEATPDERLDLLIAYLQGEVANVLGVESSKLPHTRGFFDMGIDSLTAIELRNRIQSDLATSLSSTTLFKYPNIQELSDYLDRQIRPDGEDEQSDETTKLELSRAEDEDEEVSVTEDFSEDAIDALIAEELAMIGVLLDH